MGEIQDYIEYFRWAAKKRCDCSMAVSLACDSCLAKNIIDYVSDTLTREYRLQSENLKEEYEKVLLASKGRWK